MKSNHYAKATGELRRELQRAIPRERLRELHRLQPWRHFLLLARQAALLAAGSYLAWRFDEPWIWLPAAALVGFTVFNFTVFLHEVVHRAIVKPAPPMLTRILGALYAIPSGISASQFERWHLDHHLELGSASDDPKRAHLSPKRNARWYKLLYCTPALLPIYFRAARREMRGYPPELQRRIRVERAVTVSLHLLLALSIGFFAGWWILVKVYVVPCFFVFPIAFTISRLAQHYAIDPEDPAKWGTLMKPNRFWDFMLCYSNYHLEHHYFSAIPFYRLRDLHFALEPFFAQRGIKARSFSWLIYNWFVLNRPPHSNWDQPAPGDRDASAARAHP